MESSISKNARKIEMSELSHMEELAKWIVNVRQKKLKCHRTPKRDLRREALLTHTLRNAEYEYRDKQLRRVSRWRRLRRQFLKDVQYGSCGLYNAAERQDAENEQVSKKNNWQSMCEDLSSLNNFLQQLGKVKSVVQR
ncbi:uncharacterized protein [Anoplolepis gracilipes]|uniref:uncharacterized protein n=1 Tax=Anoplolepis gracilipes TaxID=354296 RepID=UPI003B9E05CC